MFLLLNKYFNMNLSLIYLCFCTLGGFDEYYLLTNKIHLVKCFLIGNSCTYILNNIRACINPSGTPVKTATLVNVIGFFVKICILFLKYVCNNFCKFLIIRTLYEIYVVKQFI